MKEIICCITSGLTEHVEHRTLAISTSSICDFSLSLSDLPGQGVFASGSSSFSQLPTGAK